MSNEISKLINNPQSASARRRDEASSVTASGKGSGIDGKSAAHKDDNVSLTDTALRVQEVEHRLSSAPVVSSEKVDQIRQAIAEGVYRIRPELIAEKLIETERNLAGHS